MSTSTYGAVAPHQAATYAKTLLNATAPFMRGSLLGTLDDLLANAPKVRSIRLRSKKRKGKHRVYLLWIDGAFCGEFPTNKARRTFIEATAALEDSCHGTEATDT